MTDVCNEVLNEKHDVTEMDAQKVGRRLLDINELISRLQVGKSTIFFWLKTGQLPRAIKLGRSIRWFEDEIDQWLAERPRNGNHCQK